MNVAWVLLMVVAFVYGCYLVYSVVVINYKPKPKRLGEQLDLQYKEVQYNYQIYQVIWWMEHPKPEIGAKSEIETKYIDGSPRKWIKAPGILRLRNSNSVIRSGAEEIADIVRLLR